MKRFFLLIAALLLAPGCVVEFGPSHSVYYEDEYGPAFHCDEESVDYTHTQVECYDGIYYFTLCDPWGEIYRPDCLSVPPRVMFLSHCEVTHYCDFEGEWL